MKLITVNWNPTNRQLRQFAVICAFALPLLGWLWGGDRQMVTLLALAGLVVGAAGVFLPKAVKPVFLGFTIVAAPIGMVVGELAMLLIYFGVFLPFGLVFRIVKRDALQLKFDRKARTYWQPKRQPSGATSYYRQS